MNIYLLTRTDRWSYDDYDSTVVIAKNEEEAKQISIKSLGSSGWVSSSDLINAELIGKAIDKEPKIVLSSFNAG